MLSETQVTPFVGTSELLSIGTVAEAAGVSVSALRYYDEIGLVTPSARVGGKRRFDSEAVARVVFVRRAQAVGFSLEETKDILDDTVGGWSDIVAQKLAALRSQRRELDQMIAILEDVETCGCRVVLECPRLT